MEKYLTAIETANPDYLWKKNYGIPFGDWLSPEGPTPEDIVATAYWAYDVTLMQQMAHALGKHADEKKYAEVFEKIKGSFNQAYVRPDGFRSEEHTSELQSPMYLVCRLLLEKKKKNKYTKTSRKSNENIESKTVVIIMN